MLAKEDDADCRLSLTRQSRGTFVYIIIPTEFGEFCVTFLFLFITWPVSLHRLLGGGIARVDVVDVIDVVVRVIAAGDHRHAAVGRVVVWQKQIDLTDETSVGGSGCGGCCSRGGRVQPGGLLLLLDDALAHVLL